MIAMAPPRPSRPAAHPQPPDGERRHPMDVPPAAVPSAEAATAGPDGQLRHARFRLTPGLVAAAEAREHIRAAIRAWRVPVDAEVAVLLASELVANAITHGQPVNDTGEPGRAMTANAGPAAVAPVNGEPVMLSIGSYRGELRVEVHDRSRDMPAPTAETATAEAETGRGLLLVTALSAKWGSYRTAGGKAVYFTLTPDSAPPAGLARRGDGVP